MLACLACFLLLESALAAPISTNTPLPLSNGEIVFREQWVFARSSDSVAGARRELDRLEARSVLGYGLTPRMAVFGVLPIVDIHRKFFGTKSSEFGLGDAAVFARHEVLRVDAPGRTFRFAPFAGVRLPTGRDGKTGDGSVDFFGGIIATVASTRWNLDSQLWYDLHRVADGFERGDSINLASSLK